MTSFITGFETANFLASISKGLGFIPSTVSRTCTSQSFRKCLLTNSLYASLPVFWALQKSLKGYSQDNAAASI